MRRMRPQPRRRCVPYGHRDFTAAPGGLQVTSQTQTAAIAQHIQSDMLPAECLQLRAVATTRLSAPSVAHVGLIACTRIPRTQNAFGDVPTVYSLTAGAWVGWMEP